MVGAKSIRVKSPQKSRPRCQNEWHRGQLKGKRQISPHLAGEQRK